MTHHTDYTDTQFEQAFQSCIFPPALFNHEAHLRLAWLYLNHYGETEAIERISTQLRAYVMALGASDKFNQTLTVAAIKATQHFRGRSKATQFSESLAEWPRLLTDFRALMAAHYSFDVFESTVAKQRYLEPDLLPFD